MSTPCPNTLDTARAARCRPFPRVHEMLPGKLFHPVNDPHRVFALLSNEQLQVMDGKRVWCIVIAAHDHVADFAGRLVALPRDEQVEMLNVVSPMQLAVVR